MNVGIFLNKKYKAELCDYSDKIKSVLSGGGATCTVVEDNSQIAGLDILIVLGGDGTILTVASACAVNGVKIIGINCGHMGFLADFEANQLEQAMGLVLSGKFDTVKRSMLRVDYGNNTYLALNDAVIQRSTTGNFFSNTINLHAEIDGTTVDNFSSDGLIVSTPTGSTAYSLSAGGSVLTPELNAFIITPICPHSLHSRPIVFSDSSVVRINQTDKYCSLNLIVDGRVVETISGNGVFTIQKSKYSLEFISVKGNNFFDKLLIKLNIWSR